MKRLADLVRSVIELDSQARAAIAAAAVNGQFDEVARLAPLAKEIADLAVRWDDQKAATMTPSSDTPPTKEVEQKVEGVTRSLVPSAVRRELSKVNYPQFAREKGDLVKIGWSPQRDGLYEHRAPKLVVDATCRAVAGSGKRGSRFKIIDIAKGVAKSTGATNLPSYQLYVIISWLKWAGMIAQHGRQGYTIIRPQSFDTSVESAWMALPQR